MVAPDRETQHALFARAQQGDLRARDALVHANMRLVYSIARKVGRPRSEDDLADMVSEGCIGLLTAIGRFETARGHAFSTYAYRWIEHHVRECAMAIQGTKRGDAQRRPMKRDVDALVRAGASLSDAASSVAEKRGVRVETVLGVHARLSAHEVSIDKPVGEEGSATLGDLLGEDPAVDEQIDRARHLHALRARVDRFRQTLEPRELAVLDRRILADDEDAATLQELGDAFGVSKERIRQIEVKVRGYLDVSLRSIRRVDRRRCVLCDSPLRRHNKRDRCHAHGPSTTFDMRTGHCLTCGRRVPATQRGVHALLHRRGPPKTPDQVRQTSRTRQAELRSERRAAGLCVGCGGSRDCAKCVQRDRRRGASWRRRAGIRERVPELYAHAGQRLSIAQWAACTGIPIKALFQRLRVMRWSVDRALTEPIGLRPPKAVCAQGHPRTPENLYVHAKSGKRHCRTCMRERCASRRREVRRARPLPLAASSEACG